MDVLVDRVVRRARLATDEGAPGGAIGVIEHGRVEHVSYHGMANVEWAVPWGAATRYRLASITKTLMAQAALATTERGLIGLHDEVNALVAPLAQLGAPVTLHQLLTMTSGLAYDEDLCDLVGVRGRVRADYLVDLAARQPLQFEPGSDQVYACSNYRLVALLVARIMDTSWSDAVRQLVLDPLGLEMTFGGFYDELERSEATAYRPSDQSSGTGGRQRHVNHYECTGDGAIKSRMEQLLRWCVASEAGVQNVPSWARLVEPTSGSADRWYGYGICTATVAGDRVWYHGGASNTFFAHVPARGVTVACLLNEMGVPARSLTMEIVAAMGAGRGAAAGRPRGAASVNSPVGTYIDRSTGIPFVFEPGGETATILATSAAVESEARGQLRLVTKSRSFRVDSTPSRDGTLQAHVGLERIELVPSARFVHPEETEHLVGSYDGVTVPGSIHVVWRDGRLVLIRGAGGDTTLQCEITLFDRRTGVAGAIGLVADCAADGGVNALLLSTISSRRVRFIRRRGSS